MPADQVGPSARSVRMGYGRHGTVSAGIYSRPTGELGSKQEKARRCRRALGDVISYSVLPSFFSGWGMGICQGGGIWARLAFFFLAALRRSQMATKPMVPKTSR